MIFLRFSRPTITKRCFLEILFEKITIIIQFIIDSTIARIRHITETSKNKYHTLYFFTSRIFYLAYC